MYSNSAGTAAAITAAVSGFVLIKGATVYIKITTTNDANATLNVNSTGDKPIWYNGASIAASILKENHIYNFVYDGTNWELIGDAVTATKVKITNTSLPSSGNKTYYLTYSDSTTTGYQDLNNGARLYLYENTSSSYLAIGSGSTSGALTIRNSNGKYINI